MTTRYETQIAQYLIDHYGQTEINAINLATKNPEPIEKGKRWGSMPYYVAGEIAKTTGLNHLEPCQACEKEEGAI